MITSNKICLIFTLPPCAYKPAYRAQKRNGDLVKLCRAFAEEEWHKVQQCLSRSETLLHSYRELRKHLKAHVVDSLYREALQFELQLEKQQQSDLVDCINSLQLYANQQSPLAFQYCRLLGAENLYDAFSEPAPQP